MRARAPARRPHYEIPHYGKMHRYSPRPARAVPPVPFLAGKPVSGQYFVGRGRTLKAIEAIMGGAADGAVNNVMLLGPRRVGKSSILLAVRGRQERDPRVATVVINAEGASTKRRFADAYMKAVLKAYEGRTRRRERKGRLGRAVPAGPRDPREAVPELDLPVLECVRLGAKMDKRVVDQDGLLEHALGFPERLGAEKDLALLVIIDEFQSLLKWGAPFLHLFRRTVQGPTRVAYMLASSSPSMMRGIVDDAKSPLYRQLHEVCVGPLPDGVMLSFLSRRLRQAGTGLDGETARTICRLSRGMPDYLQRLTMHSYTACMVRGGAGITADDVEASYSDMLARLDPVFVAQFDSLSDLEKDVLLAISRSHDTVSGMADDIGARPTSLPRALRHLADLDVVEKRGRGRYAVVDGVFADWLASRYETLGV